MKSIKDRKNLNYQSNTNEKLSSYIETHLDALRKKGITNILTMDKKAQVNMLNWANNLANHYSTVLKNNPTKLKDIKELFCSKMDAKLAIKLLLLVSVEKGLEDNKVLELRDKFVSLGSFQFIDRKDIGNFKNYVRNVQEQMPTSKTLSFPALNKYMDLIISEQKALLEEINSFIEDIRKIKKYR